MFDDALERCNILRSYGTTAYVMLDPEYPCTRRMQDLKRWSKPMLFSKYRSRSTIMSTDDGPSLYMDDALLTLFDDSAVGQLHYPPYGHPDAQQGAYLGTRHHGLLLRDTIVLGLYHVGISAPSGLFAGILIFLIGQAKCRLGQYRAEPSGLCKPYPLSLSSPLVLQLMIVHADIFVRKHHHRHNWMYHNTFY